MMYAMAATHENHSLWRGEHVLSTNRAVTVCRAFDTTVRVSDRN